MTFPIALLIMGGLFWPAALMAASVFVGLACFVRSRWARVLFLVLAAVLATDAAAGWTLLAAWERAAAAPG